MIFLLLFAALGEPLYSFMSGTINTVLFLKKLKPLITKHKPSLWEGGRMGGASIVKQVQMQVHAGRRLF